MTGERNTTVTKRLQSIKIMNKKLKQKGLSKGFDYTRNICHVTPLHILQSSDTSVTVGLFLAPACSENSLSSSLLIFIFPKIWDLALSIFSSSGFSFLGLASFPYMFGIFPQDRRCLLDHARPCHGCHPHFRHEFHDTFGIPDNPVGGSQHEKDLHHRHFFHLRHKRGHAARALCF